MSEEYIIIDDPLLICLKAEGLTNKWQTKVYFNLAIYSGWGQTDPLGIQKYHGTPEFLNFRVNWRNKMNTKCFK